MNRRRFLGRGCALAASAWASGAAAATDWLDLPARLSPRASAQLLLALARPADVAEATVIAAGRRGIVLGSADQGRSWRQAPTPVYVTLTALFAEGSRAYAAGYDGVVLRSADHGRSWVRLLDGRTGNALTLEAAERRYQASKRDDDARHARDDVAATLEFGPANPLFGIAARVMDGRETIIAAGAFGQVFRSRDGGARWESLLDRLDNPDNLHHNAIALTRQATWVIASEGGRLYTSDDAGERWRRVDTGYNGSLFGAIESPGTADAIWAHGFGGSLFASTGRGASWQALPRLGRVPLMASARNDAGDVAIAALNGLVHVADASGRWRALKARAPGLVSALCAAGDGWIVAGNKGVARLSGETQG